MDYRKLWRAALIGITFMLVLFSMFLDQKMFGISVDVLAAITLATVIFFTVESY